jgi:hypothetical protein
MMFSCVGNHVVFLSTFILMPSVLLIVAAARGVFAPTRGDVEISATPGCEAGRRPRERRADLRRRISSSCAGHRDGAFAWGADDANGLGRPQMKRRREPQIPSVHLARDPVPDAYPTYRVSCDAWRGVGSGSPHRGPDSAHPPTDPCKSSSLYTNREALQAAPRGVPGKHPGGSSDRAEPPTSARPAPCTQIFSMP